MPAHENTTEARASALAVVQTLREAGHIAYFAGGCVRDELLGLVPADYDVATDATPDRITALFDRTAQVGASFGVVLVHCKVGNIEVATFRSDGAYSDSRRPDSVHFSDPVADADRRDFTVNALFLDPLDEAGETRSPLGGRVIDHTGGLVDLDARLIRAVGNPDDRLKEDHLRALRAVRLAAKLCFEIDPKTADAISDFAGELIGVSRERVGDEVRRMLSHPTRDRAVLLLTALRLDAPILTCPHVDDPTPTVEAIKPSATYPTALAAWAIDRGSRDQPDCGRQMLRDWRRSLCLTNQEHDRVWDLMSGLDRVGLAWETLSVARQKRAASTSWFAEMMALLAAIDAAAAVQLENHVLDLASSPGGLAPEPLLTGDDLIANGHVPGPRFKVVLDQVYDAQLEGRVQSVAQALELARELGV